ncbi:tlde1 domain-containing protein [Pantoea sp. C8B4]|uniref:tlde1 domain-containing protein n=1 Tax=Pantoea sp. C8B4 TaxID=3243083 RepID=UPI003EDA3188
MRLQPAPSNVMYGRAGFLIHGDSVAHPGGASNGCIVMPLNIRHKIWSSGDRQVEVVQ